MTASSLHEDPAWLEQRVRDQPDHRGTSDEQGIADLPPEQHHETRERDQRCEPVADGDPAEQEAGTEDGADRRRVRALDESLHVRVRAIAHEYGGENENEQEGREKDSDRGGQGAPEARHQKAHERRRDDDRAGAHHAHGDGDEELALVQPTGLLDETLLEERDDHEPAAEGERAGLQEEDEELAEHRARGGRKSTRLNSST